MLWAPILQFMTSYELIYGHVVNFLSHLSNIYWNILFLTDKVLYKTSVKTKGNSIKYLLLPNLLLWFSPAFRLQNNKSGYAHVRTFEQGFRNINFTWKIITTEVKPERNEKIPIYSTLEAGLCLSLMLVCPVLRNPFISNGSVAHFPQETPDLKDFLQKKTSFKPGTN